MRIKVAEQIASTPEKTVIQRTYKTDDRYLTVTETWTPRVHWFKPPTVTIFKWAYNVETEVADETTIFINNKVESVHVNQKAKGIGVTQIGIQVIERSKDEC